MPLEPQHVIGISMTALLALGGLAQFMQSRGGKLQKYAPVIVLTLLLLLSIGSIAVLSNMLSTSLGELVEAPSSFEAPEPIAANSDEALGGCARVELLLTPPLIGAVDKCIWAVTRLEAASLTCVGAR